MGFGNFFSNIPGGISVIKHLIGTCNAHPVYQKPYRVLQSWQKDIEEEGSTRQQEKPS